MSHGLFLRVSFYLLVTALVGLPARASILFSPDPVSVAVGQASDPITAQIIFTPIAGLPGGTQTLDMSSLPFGVTTEPSPVTYSIIAGQTSATVGFRLVAQPLAYPGNYQTPVSNLPTPAGTGFLNFTVLPMSVSPQSVTVLAGSTSEVLTAAVVFGGQVLPTGQQELVFSGLPSGATTVPAPLSYTIPPQQTGAQVPFQIAVAPGSPEGTYDVTVANSPVPAGSATFRLVVVNPGGLSATLEKSTVDTCPGGAPVANTVTVNAQGGYQGTSTVTFPTLPADLVVAPVSIPTVTVPPAKSIPFTVAARAGAAPGSRTVDVLVTGDRGVSTLVRFTVNIVAGEFTPSVSPAAVTLNGGGAAATVTASLSALACGPAGNVAVTPSGLPPGVTVTPASAVLTAPAFAPVAFSFQASSTAAPGPTTITFAFDPGVGSGGAPKALTATLTVCGPPGAPVLPVVTPQGNPLGPVTATDFLALSWRAPVSGFPPVRYEWRVNAGAWTPVAGTSATAPPRGAVDPVQLFVRAYSCSPAKGPGPEASSPPYALSPPTASFSVPASIVAGRAVTFTDTTSPQATSWLWFPGDGITATTVQSPTVTFPAAGPKVVVLIATNGSGTSSKVVPVNVLPASSARTATSIAIRSLDRERDGRLALARVEVESGTTLLLRRLEGEGEAVAFLRLLDAGGKVVVERRLVLAAGEEARHDLAAWGARGAFRLELVGPEGLDAAVEELAVSSGEPETPVTPRQPRVGETR